MKFLAAFALLLALLFTGCGAVPRVKLPTVAAAPTIQQKATHRIAYLKNHEEESYCTGTVIGPHAILTGLHCDYGEIRTIRLDLSVREYNIIGYAADDRDHIIYMLDGPAFRDIVTVAPRVAVPLEPIYYYGDGGGRYPALLKKGLVAPDRYLSDIERGSDMAYFTTKAIGGDSGAAIYGADGSIVALVTYRCTDPDTGIQYTAGFALNFPQEVLDAVK